MLVLLDVVQEFLLLAVGEEADGLDGTARDALDAGQSK